MTHLSIDLETRSTVDLTKVGVYNYALHPTTDVWCACFTVNGEVETWRPGDPVPQLIAAYVRDGGNFRAHNANFERIVWHYILAPRYGWPEPRLAQWYCTAAEAAAMALPRNLGKAGKALGLSIDEQKDASARKLMLQMSRPRKREPLTWWDVPEKVEALIDYCRQDVIAERAVAARVRRLNEQERHIWLLDQRINDRGVGVDQPLVGRMSAIVEDATAKANERMYEITAGQVTGVTDVTGLRDFLGLENVQRATLLLATEYGYGELSETQLEAAQLRLDYGKTSTAKLTAMQEYAGADGRARGMLLYHGASTGRWSGRGPQPQNLPRSTLGDNPADFIPVVMNGGKLPEEYAPPVLVSSMLRSCFVASPGRIFRSADYSQIEARMVAWIAGQEDLVRAFAAGAPIYEQMAAAIFGMEVSEIGKESDERFVGKNTVLGSGYQMGGAKAAEQLTQQSIQFLGRKVEFTEEDGKRFVETYRSLYAKIKHFWFRIEDAAMRAVRAPGRIVTVGRRGGIAYVVRAGVLWCRLPSGRFLAYHRPKIKPRLTPWGDWKDAVTFYGVGRNNQWQEQQVYGGLLTENVVQAMARDIMAAAMLRVEAAGYPVVLTVHDEILTEPLVTHGSQEEFESLMLVLPRWAEGVPVAVEGWAGDRYRK